MIKFFRAIRKTFLFEGKKANYFKYAIGEIVLVVIGILIALQINNWNETQKLIKQEQQIVLELYEELTINVKLFENVIKNNLENINKTKRFLDEPKKNSIPPDSIAIISSFFDYSPYLIEQPILNTILNSSDEKIIEYKFLLEDIRSLKKNYNYVAQSLFYLDTFWNSNSAKYLITSGLGSSMGNIYNYVEPLIIDKEFYALLNMQKTLLMGFNNSMVLTKKKSLALMDKIDSLSIHD